MSFAHSFPPWRKSCAPAFRVVDPPTLARIFNACLPYYFNIYIFCQDQISPTYYSYGTARETFARQYGQLRKCKFTADSIPQKASGSE